MKRTKSILYVQHAFALGGSVVSLKEIVIDALSEGYKCTVICPNETVASIYSSVGASTIVARIPVFNHNTVFYYRLRLIDAFRFTKMLALTLITIIKFISIVKRLKPLIIHLNSSNLILYSVLSRLTGTPVIYHVRENVVAGYLGFRRWAIRAIANKFATFIIYISEFELELLSTDPTKSIVVYNYIHDDKIQAIPEAIPREKNFQLIVLGGLFKLKGGLTIIESLKYTEDKDLLILGSPDPRIDSAELSKIEGQEYVDALLGLLAHPKISEHTKFEGRVENPFPYIAQADALIFWAASPHFPRPVFEAWLLKKPVIYFNPSFRNRIVNSQNVLMVNESTAEGLANAINRIATTVVFQPACRLANHELASQHFTQRNFKKILKLYQSTENQK